MKIDFIILITMCSYFLYNIPFIECEIKKEIIEIHRKPWHNSMLSSYFVKFQKEKIIEKE